MISFIIQYSSGQVTPAEIPVRPTDAARNSASENEFLSAPRQGTSSFRNDLVNQLVRV